MLASLSDGSNVLKSFIGSNYLVMPFAFSQSGILLGSVALLFIAVLTDRCCSILIRCKHRAVAKLKYQSPEMTMEELQVSVTYGETARVAFGPRAESLVDAALAFTQYGFCVNYFVFVLTALKVFFPAATPLSLSLFPICVLAPCVLVPNVAALGPVSMVANLAILVGFGGCLFYDGTTFEGSFVDALEAEPKANWRQFPVFFTVVLSCFEGIGTVLPVESTMASGRHNYPFMLHGVVAFTALFLGVFGLAGLLRFGADDVEQIATENLPSGSFVGQAVRGCLCVAILFTYPLQVFPVLQCGERWVFASHVTSHVANRKGGAAGVDGNNAGTSVLLKSKGVEDDDGSHSPLVDGHESDNSIVNPITADSATATTAPIALNDSTGGRVVHDNSPVSPERSAAARGGPHNLVAVNGRGAVVDALVSSSLAFFGARVITQEDAEEARMLPGITSSSSSSSAAGAVEQRVYFDAIELYGPWAGANLKKMVLLRFGVVLATAVVALLAADFYGYIASLVGALGATTLSFIMPSLLHLELFRGELGFRTRAVDVLTALLGVTSGIAGLIVTIQDWAKAA